MTDEELLALNVYEEAAGESVEGRAAIARVVQNRMAKRFFSDGTIKGTVLAKDQFSWAWFAFVWDDHIKTSGTFAPDKHTGKQVYARVAHDLNEATVVAEALRKRALPKVFDACSLVAHAVMAGTFQGPLFDKLGTEAVSYLNPRILAKLPKWATPDKLVVTIGHHDFYRA